MEIINTSDWQHYYKPHYESVTQPKCQSEEKGTQSLFSWCHLVALKQSGSSEVSRLVVVTSSRKPVHSTHTTETTTPINCEIVLLSCCWSVRPRCLVWCQQDLSRLSFVVLVALQYSVRRPGRMSQVPHPDATLGRVAVDSSAGGCCNGCSCM
jgi:hypothetical protein